ncbi:hypothetical protein FRX31_033190, partial [Thalictrum thalictroides]
MDYGEMIRSGEGGWGAAVQIMFQKNFKPDQHGIPPRISKINLADDLQTNFSLLEDSLFADLQLQLQH